MDNAAQMDNRAVVERAFDAMNQRDFDVLGGLHSENHLYRDPRCPNLGIGSQEVRRVNQAVANAVPDVQYIVDALTERDDEVYVQWTARSSTRGRPVRQTQPGLPTQVAGGTILRLEAGKIIETRHELSVADLIQGLTGDSTQGRCP